MKNTYVPHARNKFFLVRVCVYYSSLFHIILYLELNALQVSFYLTSYHSCYGVIDLKLRDISEDRSFYHSKAVQKKGSDSWFIRFVDVQLA